MEAPKPDPHREALTGLVERVTFHNPETGFCVLRVKVRGQRDLVTVVGRAALISAGEFVQASGVWVNAPMHGLQFKVRWSPIAGQFGGWDKLGSGLRHAANPIPSERPAWASAGVLPPSAECGRSAL